MLVLSGVFRVTLLRRCRTFRLRPTYNQLTAPGPDHGRRRPEQAAKRTQGIRGYMATGHHGNTGIGVRGGRQGFAVDNRNEFAADLAAAQARQSHASLPPARNTATGELGRHRALLERRVPRALAGTLPGPSCGFVADAKEAEENKALPGGATRATTLPRPLLSAAAQMCRTFQKSAVHGVVRPCRDSMPGTLLPESRRRMS